MFDTISVIDNCLREKLVKKIGNIDDILVLDRYIVEISGLWHTSKDQNIGKYGYIGNWILRIYRKYR